MPKIFKRVVASFIFDILHDPSVIATSGNEAFQHYSNALLRDFLKGDSEKIMRLISQTIALEMENWSTGTIEEAIASPVIENADANALSIFDVSINNLPPIEKEFWKGTIDDPELGISIATEPLFDTFKVQLVSSQLQEAIPVNIIDATPSTQNNDDYDDDIEDEDFASLIRLDDEEDDEGDEEASETQYVGIDALMGQGFTKHLTEYRATEKQKEAKQQ